MVLSKLKVLIVHDSSSAAFIFQRYLPVEINAIYFSEHEVISPVKNPLFFVKNGFSSQVNQIKELSNEYDVFLCFGWIAAAICYLAGVNYVMYFVDSYIDPEYRIRRDTHFLKKCFLSELYKDTLQYASKTVAALPHDAKILQKYSPDTKIIFQMVDPEMFNPNVKKIDLGQNKFTFLSPQRIEIDKGQLIMWDAIKLTKSDFVVLQTDWGSGTYYEQAIAKKPGKVKIIPKIKRSHLPSYYISSDTLLGQISFTSCGSIEREAALCGIPIFCYSPHGFTNNDPFFKNNNPSSIAEHIDKIVEDKNFRKELAKIQNEWVRDTFDNKKTSIQWQEVFEEVTKDSHMPKKRYLISLKLINILEKITKKDFSTVGRGLNHN